jgi:integrase
VKRRGLDGPARSLLYLTAARTGLRARELGRLVPESFDIDASPPRVTAEARSAKNRKRAELPLADDLVGKLRGHLAGVRRGKPVWPGTWASNGDARELIGPDLKEAGIPYRDDQGRVFDFHSLRGQFATDLLRSGTPLAHAQKLLRHSTPALTAKHYARLDIADLAECVNRLGRPQQPAPKARRRRAG